MTAAADPAAGKVGLVVGDGELARAVALAVDRAGRRPRRLRRPTDLELAGALAAGPAFAAVISHDDIQALRWALVAEHARPGIRLLVTIFDRTVAAQLRRTVPNCHVISLADAAVPALTAACLGHPPPPAPAPRPSRLERRLAGARSQLRPFDASSWLLVGGVLGLALLLALDTAVAALALDHGLLDALYEAVRTATTVGPNALADHGPAWYRALSVVLMLGATALVAMATAGLVNRALSWRLVTIVGRRTLPRSGHVIVVGLGQVGVRLCLQLRRVGIGAVAIERDRDAPLVHLARHLDVPVVIGDGRERGLLERVGARRARAVAAVTSDDLENIAVTMAALAVRPDAHVVLRAGDGDVVAESRALFAIATVCDVTRIAAAHIAALVTGEDVAVAYEDDGAVVLRRSDGTIFRAA